jgi:UTP---glucose-1-phosphate uridylyltransferase
MQQQIEFLQNLLNKLNKAIDLSEKIQILNEQLPVKKFLTPHPFLNEFSQESEFALKALLALDQGPIVFGQINELKNPNPQLKKIVDILLQLEKNYQSIDGIIGYHLTILKFILQKKEPIKEEFSQIKYIKPQGKNISTHSSSVNQYVQWGIESLPILGEIYPVGGAGDRLGLIDKKTGIPLPAAKLKFTGKTLLEGLFQDLQARECLYYQMKGQRILTPVALMTSHEKNNHQEILHLCEEKEWFGRPKESIRFFIQSLVPVVAANGNWSLKGPLELTLKPGGHGLLWKLALEAGIFDWMESQNRRKLLIRQINNPIAGIDQGLLAFLGLGCHEDKSFGFASCQRLLNTPEGMNVFLEKKRGNEFEYSLTNIEYTDFEQKGIQDIPEQPNSIYSAFPSNTNILFADIKTVRQAAQTHPLPGLLINMKNKVPTIDKDGKVVQMEGGRLESTMQNIADVIVEQYPHPLKPENFEHFKSFITFNERRKTISVTKSLHEKGKSILGTPEGCLYDLLQNYKELFRDFCHFQLPSLGTQEDYMKNGPPFFILLHPALGPLFNVIAEKIKGGILEIGSELQLDIADLQISQLDLKGSLRIISENVLGKKNDEGFLVYGQDTSKCTLRNVRVNNEGIDRKATQIYWTNELIRKEELYVHISGNGEFIAENIVFNGNHHIEVPDSTRITAIQNGKKVEFQIDKLSLSDQRPGS